MLSQTLAQRVSENLRLLASLHGFYYTALEAFATAIDVKHVNIHGHSLRWAATLPRSARRWAWIAMTSPHCALQVISNSTRSPWISACSETRSLDAEEFREMADHTVMGHQIVSGVEFPGRAFQSSCVRTRTRRRFRISGRASMEDVAMPVRIIGLADTFDAMTSERPYREPLSVGNTLSEIVRLSPQKFDPNAVHGLLLQIRCDSVGSNACPFYRIVWRSTSPRETSITWPPPCNIK